jgi:hypothetical protein
MPYSYLIDTTRQVVFSKVWGTMTDDQACSHATALRDDPRFTSGLNQIIDMRGLSDLQMTKHGAKDLAHLVPFRADAKRAFLVGMGEAAKLSEVLWTYTEAGVDQYTLFRELPEAMEFVGLDATTAWPDEAPDKTFG